MKRNIKFRAWDNKYKEMVDWYMMCQTAFNRSDFNMMYEILSGSKFDFEVMQSTGLRDKYGREIYEGDIVHYLYTPGKKHSNYDQISTIEWKSTGFYLSPVRGSTRLSSWLVSVPGASAYDEINSLFEVIGNIYQNPEFLKIEGVIGER